MKVSTQTETAICVFRVAGRLATITIAVITAKAVKPSCTLDGGRCKRAVACGAEVVGQSLISLFFKYVVKFAYYCAPILPPFIVLLSTKILIWQLSEFLGLKNTCQVLDFSGRCIVRLSRLRSKMSAIRWFLTKHPFLPRMFLEEMTDPRKFGRQADDWRVFRLSKMPFASLPPCRSSVQSAVVRQASGFLFEHLIKSASLLEGHSTSVVSNRFCRPP